LRNGNESLKLRRLPLDRLIILGRPDKLHGEDCMIS